MELIAFALATDPKLCVSGFDPAKCINQKLEATVLIDIPCTKNNSMQNIMCGRRSLFVLKMQPINSVIQVKYVRKR